MNFTNIPAISFYHDETIVASLIVAFILNGIAILFIESIAANRLDSVVDEVRELRSKMDEINDGDSDIKMFEPATFQFADGTYSHYFEDPDGDFVLVLPEVTLHGDSIIEATMGHVTRSNPDGNPILAYLDYDGCRQTHVLPEYAGRRFCNFINGQL